MENFIKKNIVITVLLTLCESALKSNDACVVIRKTLSDCYSQGDNIYFTQSNTQLTVASFQKTFYREMIIKCFYDFGINLNAIPTVDFHDVNKLELHQCSLLDDTLLTTLKKRFNMKNLDSVLIEYHRNINVTLSKALFEKFRDLKNLQLTTKNLSFNSDVFKPMVKLLSMKLNVYDFTVLPSDVFLPLQNLETLVIRNSGKMKTETRTLNFTLKWCINLQNFHLSGIKTPIRIKNLFNNNLRLERVDIINNNIAWLSEDIFNGSKEIVEVSLAFNDIRHLPGKIFMHQMELEKVDLSHNDIVNLDDNIFSNNVALKSIILSHNKLSSTNR